MIQKYTSWCLNIWLCPLFIFITNIQTVDGNNSSLKNSFFLISSKNIFQILEKPITYLLSMKNHFTPIYNTSYQLYIGFYQWHENVFYYPIDNQKQKKMFLSARIFTTLIPWVIVCTVVYTNPYLLNYIWNVNYEAVSSMPSHVTPAFIAQKIGNLSSFTQNCIMISAEKGLQWFMSRKIMPDMCLNPATWFTDTANHHLINMITSFFVIIFSWIYILYCVYLNANTHHKNLIKIIFFQLCIRYALYLANLKNNIHSLVFSEHLGTYVKNTGDKLNLVHYAMQKELINAIENVNKTIKKIVHDVQ